MDAVIKTVDLSELRVNIGTLLWTAVHHYVQHPMCNNKSRSVVMREALPSSQLKLLCLFRLIKKL